MDKPSTTEKHDRKPTGQRNHRGMRRSEKTEKRSSSLQNIYIAYV